MPYKRSSKQPGNSEFGGFKCDCPDLFFKNYLQIEFKLGRVVSDRYSINLKKGTFFMKSIKNLQGLRGQSGFMWL